MRSIIITIYVISLYSLKINNREDYIGELDNIIEVIQVGLYK